MPVERNDEDRGTETGAAVEQVPVVSRPLSRRALLRGAAVTVPTILTLHSGAALAFSSNLIGVDPAAEPVVGDNYACLDLSSSSTVVEVPDRLNTYDLGDPVNADVTAIPTAREHFRTKDRSSPVSGPVMCDEGGTFYFKDSSNQWATGTVKQGVLLSATAMASFTGKIRITYI